MGEFLFIKFHTDSNLRIETGNLQATDTALLMKKKKKKKCPDNKIKGSLQSIKFESKYNTDHAFLIFSETLIQSLGAI